MRGSGPRELRLPRIGRKAVPPYLYVRFTLESMDSKVIRGRYSAIAPQYLRGLAQIVPR